MEIKSFYEESAREHNSEFTAIPTGKRKFIAHDDRYEIMTKYLQEELSGRKDLQILDVGCGDGVYEKLLDPQIISSNKFFGLDISDLQRERSKIVFDEIKEMDFDKDAIPYGDGRFDYVICSEVVEHLFFPEKILIEIQRVLKRGGCLSLQHQI